jgi:mutator family transposase
VAYLFVDGVAERLHAGMPRQAVLRAWGITEDERKVLLHLAPGTKEDTASCRAFFEDLKRRGLPDPLLAVTGWRPGTDPRGRDVLPAGAAPALFRAPAAQPPEQGAGDAVAGDRDPGPRLLRGGLGGARDPCFATILSRRMNASGRRSWRVSSRTFTPASRVCAFRSATAR